MILSSLLFIYGFLPFSLVLYGITPKKYKNASIMLLSVIYCAAVGLRYLGFVLIFAAWNLIMAKAIEKLSKNRALSAFPLAIGIIADIASMLIFRTQYFTDITEKLKLPQEFFPIGISFMTLSAIGSLIDVYSGRIKKKISCFSYILYIIFFPKLFMGPLVDYRSFTSMTDKRKNTLSLTGKGLGMFIRGLTKRVVPAGCLYTLYSSVNTIATEQLSTLTAWLGVASYTLCMYFTLSGYSDMGAGIARCFGYRLYSGFDYPLLSFGINDFRKRWHKPVINWFGRYVFNPLDAAVKMRWLRYSFLILTWGLIGLWYGLTVNFFMWGFIIGIAAAIEGITVSSTTLRSTSVVYTTLVLSLGSAFLSREGLREAFMYFLAMIGGNSNLADHTGLYLLRSYGLVLIVSMLIASGIIYKLAIRPGRKLIRRIAGGFSPIISIFLLALCTALIAYSGEAEMILFRL